MKNYPIGGNVVINGVLVPLIHEGWKYLDWRRVKGTKAPLLTSPYGERHFVLGGEEGRSKSCSTTRSCPTAASWSTWRPRRRWGSTARTTITCTIVTICSQPSTYKLTKIVDRLVELGIKHDADRHGADAWYFQRAIGKEAQVPAHLGQRQRAARPEVDDRRNPL